MSIAKIAERCPELSLRWLLPGEGEMLERGGGAHLSSHSHIPGASASFGPPPQHLGYGRPHVGVRGERVKPLLEARPYLVQPPRFDASPAYLQPRRVVRPRPERAYHLADRAPADVQPLGYHPRIIAAPPERHHEQVPRVHDLLALGLRHYVALRNPRDLAHVTQDAGEYL